MLTAFGFKLEATLKPEKNLSINDAPLFSLITDLMLLMVLATDELNSGNLNHTLLASRKLVYLLRD